MNEPVAGLISALVTTFIFGSVFGAILIIPERLEKSQKILRRLKYLSDKTHSNGCITVFDLATEAEISSTQAKKILEKYVQELDGEKLVSAKGEIYYVFPRGDKINQQEERLKLESATDRRIKALEEKINQILAQQIDSQD